MKRATNTTCRYNSIAAIFVLYFCIATFGSDCFAQTASAWKKLALDKKFEQLQKNYKKDLQMEDSLYISQGEKEWEALYQRRVDFQDSIRPEDDEIISEIYDYYRTNIHLPAYQIDSLLYKTSKFYRQTLDAFTTEHLISFVLPYYANRNDLEHMFQCNAALGLALTQIAKEGETNDYFNALEYLNKAADYGRDNYKDLKLGDSYDYLMRVYQELTHLRWLELHKMTIAEAYDRYRELQDIDVWLRNTPTASARKKTRKSFDKIYYEFEYNILRYLMSDKSQYRLNPVVKLLSKFYKKHYDLKLKLWNEYHTTDYEITDQAKVQYYSVLNYSGLATPLQTFHNIDSVYQQAKKAPKLEPRIVDLISFINEAVYFLDITDELDEVQKEKYALSYLDDLMYYTKIARSIRSQSQLYDQLEAVVTNPHFYERFSGDNRNDLILNLLIKSDAEIYAHCTLVTWIGWNMMEILITKKPHLLVGLFNSNTEQDVIKNHDAFQEFFWNACLTHDLGLNRMSPTTNRHYRSLTSHEIQLLRNHVNNSASILRIDNTYHSRFYDMVLGHHKWYNGLGYPESFDNLGSQYRVLIDLLAISDFLEGGSELPSEGYGGGLDKRLEELKQGSGTRFNPELVEMVFENENLLARIRQLCGDEQRSSRYSVYKEYFDDNNSK